MKNGLLKLQQYHQKTFDNSKRMKFDNKSNYLENSNSNSNSNNVYNSSSSSSTTSFQNTGGENSKILLPPIQNQNPTATTASQNFASYQLAGSTGMSYPTANNTTGFNPSIPDNYSNAHHDRIGSSDVIIDNASPPHGNNTTDTLPSFTN
ncbi:unnamed protein product [[Candida] boidinii]|nr:unnamed protein product [[Candida] boidinii]